MLPCTLKANGFSLSWQSICHVKFGPLQIYLRWCSLLLLLSETPSGSRSFTVTLTSLRRHIIPHAWRSLCSSQYPILEPSPPISSTVAFLWRLLLPERGQQIKFTWRSHHFKVDEDIDQHWCSPIDSVISK